MRYKTTAILATILWISWCFFVEKVRPCKPETATESGHSQEKEQEAEQATGNAKFIQSSSRLEIGVSVLNDRITVLIDNNGLWCQSGNYVTAFRIGWRICWGRLASGRRRRFPHASSSPYWRLKTRKRLRRLLPRSAERERSEEHTSELQSRPHISYAVFCLKKKKKTLINHTSDYK